MKGKEGEGSVAVAKNGPSSLPFSLLFFLLFESEKVSRSNLFNSL